MAQDPVVRLLFRLVVIAIGIVVLSTTYADPDLWGHVLFGRDIVASRAIVQADPYSFTSDRPWINHEWLAEVAMHAAYRAGGAAGLVALRIGLIVAAIAIAFWSLRRRTAGAIRDAILLLVILGTAWVTVSVRPQLFSVVLFVALLASLVEVEAGVRRAMLWWPAIMAIWVNAHGGWVVGLGMLAIWTAFAILRATSSRDRGLLVAMAAAAALATLANPYGWGMWQFIAGTVRLGRDIQEWQPITSHPLPHLALWFASALVGLAAIARSRGPGTWVHAAMAGGLAFASWRVARLDAFFCLTVALLLAPRLATRAAAVASRPVPLNNPVWIIVAVAAVAILTPVALRARTQIGCIEIEGAWPPDVSAVEYLKARDLRGRLLTWFDWGEYAIWHLAPNLRVSIDGRRETVYSDRLTVAHFEFYAGAPAGRALPDAIDADYIWIPRALPVVPHLTDDGWIPVFESGTSMIFARSADNAYRDTEREPPPRRCFPGP